MKTSVLHITAALVCAAILLSASCTQTADKETVLLYVRASEAYAQGKFAETVEILRREKTFPPALMLRVKAEYFSGEFDRAEKYCRRLVKMRPSSFEARLYLARILREKGDFSGAVKLTEFLLTDNPQDIRTLRLAAELAADMGKNDEAAAFLDRAAELSAESAMVLLDRARLRWIAGRGAEALEDLSQARAMLPWDTPLSRSITNLEKRIKEAML